jgi:hypothetical protein
VEQGGAGEERVISTGNFESFLDKVRLHLSRRHAYLFELLLNISLNSAN